MAGLSDEDTWVKANEGNSTTLIKIIHQEANKSGSTITNLPSSTIITEDPFEEEPTTHKVAPVIVVVLLIFAALAVFILM